jgi:carbonic anhydrase/acetyltransferase-like protein (isoleucine patch superfamily)
MMFRPYNNLFAEYVTDELRQYASDFAVRGDRPYPSVGHDVWIGASVTLAMGIKLGTGCVIAANSVVTKDVPPYAIVGGNPASLIKFRFDFGLISALLRSEWWNFDPRILFASDPEDPAQTVARIEKGEVPRFVPRHIEW